MKTETWHQSIVIWFRVPYPHPLSGVEYVSRTSMNLMLISFLWRMREKAIVPSTATTRNPNISLAIITFSKVMVGCDDHICSISWGLLSKTLLRSLHYILYDARTMNNPLLQTSGTRVSHASELPRKGNLLNSLLDFSSQGPVGLGKGPQICFSQYWDSTGWPLRATGLEKHTAP